MNLKQQLAALEGMTVGELIEQYAALFGEQSRSRHKAYLVRRIAWRLQANAEGGLSERATQRAEELANPADARVTPPREKQPRPIRFVQPARSMDDSRLPPVGNCIGREYKGKRILVTVTPDGFEYQGENYDSLSAVARKVTGSHINGYRFFQLGSKR